MINDISFEKLLENLFDGVYFVDKKQKVMFWNKSAERITGYNKNDILGKRCSENILRHIDESGNELCINGCPLKDTIKNGSSKESSVFLHHKDGHRIPIIVRTSPILDKNNNVIGAIEIFSDNSNVLRMKTDLENFKKEINIDQLTKVYNRKFCDMMLSTKFYEFERHNNEFGLIFLDIDRFKLFNDKYGHKTGDNVLILVCKTINNLIRKYDFLCRYGGEEFIIICSDIKRNELEMLGERIRLFIEKSFLVIDDKKLTVTVSLGITLVSKGDTISGLLERADRLMYKSKSSGRNRYTFE